MQNTINIIKKQNEIDILLDKALKLIEPLVTDKKITKRETDKANNLLKLNKIAISVYIRKYDYMNNRLELLAQDRSISGVEESTIHIKEDSRSLYLDDYNLITLEYYQKQYSNIKKITEKQIIFNINKMDTINKKIDELENSKRDIKYKFYLE